MRKKKKVDSSSIQSPANAIVEKLCKDKTLARLLVDTEVDEEEFISTNVASLNLVFSGRLNGGIKIGAITTIAAPPQLGKSMIGYNLLKKAHKRGMTCVLIDTEGAFTRDMAEEYGLLGSPNFVRLQTDQIPEIKGILARMNEGLSRAEASQIFILLDSWGGLMEAQVREKALEMSSAVNMSAAKFKNELASLLRSYGNTVFVVNHVMEDLGSFFKGGYKIPGGKRLMYLSDSVAMGASSAKFKNEKDEVVGKVVTIQIQKGREAKELNKSKYLIRYEGGLDPFFGLLEEAMECGCVFKSKPGQYSRKVQDVDQSTGEVVRGWRESEMYCKEFWIPVFQDPKFIEYCTKKFKFENTKVLSADIDLDDLLAAQCNEPDSSNSSDKDDSEELDDSEEWSEV